MHDVLKRYLGKWVSRNVHPYWNVMDIVSSVLE